MLLLISLSCNTDVHKKKCSVTDGELVMRELGNIWVSRTSPQLDMVGAGEWGWAGYTSIEGLPDTITAMCCVGDHVWLGDSAGNIHGYK